ncbi:MAG: hypothetical protein ACFCBW_16200 [Candidatus Competibacterales bacterium]
MAMTEPELPAVAQPTWTAYRAMGETKRRHFDLLRQLDDKYSQGGSPTLAEQARLATLLKAHDAQVETFKRRLAELRQRDPVAHGTLVQALANDAQGAP